VDDAPGSLHLTTRKSRARISTPRSADNRAFLKEKPAPPKVRTVMPLVGHETPARSSHYTHVSRIPCFWACAVVWPSQPLFTEDPELWVTPTTVDNDRRLPVG
jgi:hypothetical protein